MSFHFLQLELDFELMYPNAVDALNLNWALKRTVILQLLNLECKSSPEVVELVETFESLTEGNVTVRFLIFI